MTALGLRVQADRRHRAASEGLTCGDIPSSESDRKTDVLHVRSGAHSGSQRLPFEPSQNCLLGNSKTPSGSGGRHAGSPCSGRDVGVPDPESSQPIAKDYVADTLTHRGEADLSVATQFRTPSRVAPPVGVPDPEPSQPIASDSAADTLTHRRDANRSVVTQIRTPSSVAPPSANLPWKTRVLAEAAIRLEARQAALKQETPTSVRTSPSTPATSPPSSDIPARPDESGPSADINQISLLGLWHQAPTPLIPYFSTPLHGASPSVDGTGASPALRSLAAASSHAFQLGGEQQAKVTLRLDRFFL